MTEDNIISTSIPLAEYRLGCEEVARLLGYHVQYVRALASQGKLPCIKRGRKWLFAEVEIHNYLTELTNLAQRKDENNGSKVNPDSMLQ